MDANEVMLRLQDLSDPETVTGMARFGINPKQTLGVTVPKLRDLAKELGRNHELAADENSAHSANHPQGGDG